DAEFRTTAEGIYVAGEPTGVAGAERSWAEGQVAGQCIAESLGAAVDPERRAQANRVLASSNRFSAVMQHMFEPRRKALAELSRPDEVFICRCELVTSGRLEAALAENPFVSSANAVKLECRSGMGPCQGRYCEGTVSARIALARQSCIEEAGYFHAILPTRPVPLRAYCDMAGGERSLDLGVTSVSDM